MIFVAAIDTQEFRLCLPIAFRYMTAARASATGVVWRHGQQYAAIPRQLVVQLPPELAPALIKNGTVQTGLLLHPLAVLFVAAPGRPGHIPYLQILNADERVVLADRRGGFVQEVFPGNADINANGACRGWQRWLYFPFGLNRHEPFAARLAHGGVAHLAQHLAAVAIAQPTEFGQENAAVVLIEIDLFRLGIAKAVAAAFALETREVGAFGKIVLVGFFQVFQGMLQCL